MNASQRRKIRRQTIREFPIGTKIKNKYTTGYRAVVIDHQYGMLIKDVDIKSPFYVNPCNWEIDNDPQ